MDLRACKTVIVFGGSFDPPHVAHVELPRRVMRAIDAQAVAYVPAAVSPFKTRQAPTAAEHRLAMLRLALADQPHAVIRSDELDRPAPSYTVDTLEALAQQLPGVRLRLLLGADQLATFDHWRRVERIVALAEPVVMRRPPATLTALPAGYDALAWARRVVDVPAMEVSSTLIRKRLAAGESITGLVHRDVERYIHEHRLYHGNMPRTA